MRGLLSAHWAHAERRHGSVQQALIRARESVELLRRTPAYLNHGYRELLACLVAQCDFDAVTAMAETAMQYLRQRPGICYWDLGLALVCVDAFERTHGLSAATLARQELQNRMATILGRAPDAVARAAAEKEWNRAYAVVTSAE